MNWCWRASWLVRGRLQPLNPRRWRKDASRRKIFRKFSTRALERGPQFGKSVASGALFEILAEFAQEMPPNAATSSFQIDPSIDADLQNPSVSIRERGLNRLGAALRAKLFSTVGQWQPGLSHDERMEAIQQGLLRFWGKIESQTHHWQPGVGTGASLNYLFYIVRCRASNVARSARRRNAHLISVRFDLHSTDDTEDHVLEDRETVEKQVAAQADAEKLRKTKSIDSAEIDGLHTQDELRAKQRKVIPDRVERLARAIAKLPTQSRRIAEIVYGDVSVELTLEQIRESYQKRYGEFLKEPTAKSQKRRAYQALQKILAAETAAEASHAPEFHT